MKGFVHNVKKQSPLILAIAGSIGVIGTAAMAVKATPKAILIVRMDKEMRRAKAMTIEETQQSTLDIVKLTWKCYIPSAVVGLATISCIMSSAVLSRHQLKTITSAYILLDRTYREYKDAVKKLYGENANREVQKEIIEDLYEDSDVSSKGETLIFYEENYGKLFERTMLEVVQAEYNLNRKFALDGEASINDFLDFLGLEHVDFGDCIGWLSESNYDFYGHLWIEFKHEPITLDDGMECRAINITTPPSVYY